MPTYEYRREDGTTFEVFQRMSDDPLAVDPETGQKVTRMVGGGTGLIFKGDGFYLTDYARKGENDTATSGEKTSADASTSDAASEAATAPDSSSDATSTSSGSPESTKD